MVISLACKNTKYVRSFESFGLKKIKKPHQFVEDIDAAFFGMCIVFILLMNQILFD